MRNIICYKQRLSLVVFSMMVAGCLTGQEKQSSCGDDLAINDLFKEIKNLTDAREFKKASLLVREVDIEKLIKKSIIDKKTGKVKLNKLIFLAYAEETILIPGIPINLETKELADKKYRVIPGTGDDLPISDQKLRAEWFDAVSNLALKYNTRVYKLGIEYKKFDQPVLSE